MDVVFAFDELYADVVFAALQSVLQAHPADMFTIWLASTPTVLKMVGPRAARQAGGRGRLYELPLTGEFRELGLSLKVGQ